MNELKPVLRDDFEEHMSISFYVRFWQLSLHDMFIPSYETETKRLQVKLAAVNADRSDVSREGVKRKEAEKKRLTELQDGLRNEMKSHIASYQGVRKKLGKEKDHWFTHIPPAKHSALTDAIIQECLFPRIILSPSDAQFTARFIFFAHQQGTPGFRTLQIFDRMLREKQILATLFQCTAREAENFGRFLHDILKELRQWRIDKSTFEKIGLGGTKKQLPGLATKLNPDLTPKDVISYEQFRRILYKWHIQLHEAMKASLSSGEYMHIRNGCIVLKAVHKQWPEVIYQGDQVQRAITHLSLNDERQDLKLSALSLLGDLKKRSKDWIIPQTFRLVSGDSHLTDVYILTTSRVMRHRPKGQAEALRHVLKPLSQARNRQGRWIPKFPNSSLPTHRKYYSCLFSAPPCLPVKETDRHCQRHQKETSRTARSKMPRSQRQLQHSGRIPQRYRSWVPNLTSQPQS
jgi:THO complex subunit 2